MCDELDQTARAGLERLASGGNDFEVNSFGCAGGETADLPGGGLTNSDLCFAHTAGFFVSRDGMANKTRDLEFLGGLRWDLLEYTTN